MPTTTPAVKPSSAKDAAAKPRRKASATQVEKHTDAEGFVWVSHHEIADPARVPVEALDIYQGIGWRLATDDELEDVENPLDGHGENPDTFGTHQPPLG